LKEKAAVRVAEEMVSAQRVSVLVDLVFKVWLVVGAAQLAAGNDADGGK